MAPKFSHALKTVRISDIPSDADQEEVWAELKRIISAASKASPKPPILKSFFSRTPVIIPPAPVTSLATQLGQRTATITFPSEEEKDAALAYRNRTPYDIDDIFNNITVLYSAEAPELE
jgi:hypothetical protein